MKRSHALVALSHEHHQALFVALRLRRAADPPAERQLFLDFFDREGVEHFRIEEEVLLPYLANDLPSSDPQVARMLNEHEQLRQRAHALHVNPHTPAQELQAIGELLSEHVRFEERQLFPRIEALLDEERLNQLGQHLKLAERHTDETVQQPRDPA